MTSLRRRQGRAAEHLAQDDDRAAHRRHQHGKQEAFFAVLNHRHHGKDGSEEHDHDESAGEKIVEIVLATGRSVRAKRGAEARANHKPEEQRRSDDADHTRALPVEAYDFAPPQRERWQQQTGIDGAVVAGKAVTSRVAMNLLSFRFAVFSVLFGPEAVTSAADEHVFQTRLVH